MNLADTANEMRREVALKKISSNVVRYFHQGSAIFRSNRESNTEEVRDLVYCTLINQGGPYADAWDETFYLATWPKFLKAEFEKSFPGEQVVVDVPHTGVNSDNQRILRTKVKILQEKTGT